MIDPTTTWIEIYSMLEARFDVFAILVELAWLTRYPLLSKIIIDRGKMF